MKKKRKLVLIGCLLVALLVSMLIPIGKTESYQAANSYTNAEVFYESTGQKNGKHIECYNGMVYFATKAEAATSSTALKYTSVGFDVTLTGAGKTLTFAVKRGGSLTELTDANVNGTYKYRLYCITTDDLYTLASKVNKTAADAIFASDEFDVRMDAIMTTRQNDVDHGAIKENGDGTISVVRNPIYHLNKTSDLNELKKEFNTDFDSFKNITAKLTNYTTTIYYSVGEGVTMNSGYTAKAFTLSGTTVNNTLYQGSSVYKKDYKTLQRFYLLNTGMSGINLKKTGYHLGDGNGGAVWKKSNGETFAITKDYGPKNLSDQAGKKDKIVFLYANWKPNTYTITYDPAGGSGSITPTQMTYDTSGTLRENTFKKTGYYLPEGEEWIDADGNTYANGQTVSNLTATHEGTVILYANWKPSVFTIDLDKQGGTGGTDSFFAKYGIGFFSSKFCLYEITTITEPSRLGYDFTGYYSWINGGGSLLVDSLGKINVNNEYFTTNAVGYAGWSAKQFNITFDKQGGIYGSDSAVATYDSVYPVADAPVRAGYSFKGYFTEKNGAGTMIYTETMSSDTTFKETKDTTLYAYWEDDVTPILALNVSIGGWTNQKVTLTADAWDYGSGLKSVEIYQIQADGSYTSVAKAENLNGAKVKSLGFQNTTEGIARYKAVATDMSGNTAESYNVVYYDTKAPTGDVITAEIDGNTFRFEIDITDINTGD